MRLAATLLCLSAWPAAADPLRIATWDPGLTRDGPGLLLRDIRAGDPQVMAAARVIAHAAPDVILLTGFDWDHDGLALNAFAEVLKRTGHDMAHRFAAMPNSGVATGLDLDGDGRFGTPRDAQGFGSFTGQDAMAVLSRLPIAGVTDHSATLWRDMPGNLMPADTSPDIAAIQRLSSTAHWDIRLESAQGPLHLLGWSAAPPAFEPRNPQRNHDEAAFWLSHLPAAPFVLAGKINIDPADGDGIPEALQALLNHAQDPLPRGASHPLQSGVNAMHHGDPALDTAEFRDSGPGNLRVDYVLPSKSSSVIAAGVLWPGRDDPLAPDVEAASNHRLVWVDLSLP